MNKSLIADLIVSIHFGIVLGGALRRRFIRNFWFRAIHLTMILIVVFETIFGITCPLTDWEYELRVAAGQQNAVGGSFVARLIQQIIFYEFPLIVFIIGYCIFGIAVLTAWRLIPPLLPWKQRKS
jgi:hypothetical protein